MGRRKRAFTDAVAQAEKRLSGLKAIDPTLDLGNGLSVSDFEQDLDVIKAKIVTYNTALSTADKESNEINAGLKAMRAFNRRILAAIGAVFGYDSNEYEMVGGTRLSDIKRKGSAKGDLDDTEFNEEE